MAILYRVLLVSWFLSVSSFWFNAPVLAVSAQDTSDIFNVGINNVRQQNYQQALVDFTQVINRQDNLVGAAYSNRCLVNLQLQNYAAAEADCTTAIEDNSNNIEAYLNLGLAYYRQGKFNQAIAKYQQVIQRDKRDYRAYYNRGLAYLALNNYQQAIADYQTALMSSPDSSVESKSLIYNDLALTYVMLVEDEQAVFNFDRAIALDGNNYNAYFNRGCAHHRQGKYEAAIEDFSQVVQLQPDFIQAYVYRGILRHQIGEQDTAFADLNFALQQYQKQGNNNQYDLVFNLKQKLFYSQPNRIV
jgi:tetratricopeptide (TPR) repeat protein